MSFVKSYSEHFRSYRHDVTEKARQYTSGLMQAGGNEGRTLVFQIRSLNLCLLLYSLRETAYLLSHSTNVGVTLNWFDLSLY